MATSSVSVLVSLFAFFSLASFAYSLPGLASPTITWSNCTASDPPSLDCGSIQVPLDYENPKGDNITLAIARLKAPNRKGNLMYNPGGPGGSATQALFAVAELGAQFFSADLLDNYDIIGLDPRGVGLSAGISCDPDLWNARKSIWPHNEKEFDDMVTANRAFYASCANLTGSLFNHVDTTSVAKDFELLRLALGDEKLNLFAQSYGSQIGEQYAELFPENVGRMALDAILDHSTSEVSGIFVESQGYESTFLQFFEWCNTTTDCSFYAQDSKSIFQNLISQADKDPIPAPGCNATGITTCRSTVTGKDLLLNSQGYLQVQIATLISPGWVELSAALGQAVAGNATLLSTPLSTSQTDPIFASVAIACQDWSHDATYETLNSRMNMLNTTSPLVQGSSQSYMVATQCIDSSQPLSNPPHVLSKNVTKAPPILLVNSFWDPSTSIVWANGVRDQLPGSVLVMRRGVGHTSYQVFGESSGVIDGFLIDGILPRDGAVFET